MEFIGDDPTAGDPDRPLLLLLHGFGSDERDLPGLVPGLGDRFDWVSLRGPIALPQRGFAWSPPIILPDSPPQPDAVRAGATSILGWIDAAAPGRRVIPIGFSQGGLMVTQIMRARPRGFEAGVVLAGFHAQFEEPGDAELAVRRPPMFFGWGAADAVIPASAFQATSDWLRTHSTPTEHRYEGLGHSISAEMLEHIAAFLVEAVPAR
jgi:phospholipase/carboxylesterase